MNEDRETTNVDESTGGDDAARLEAEIAETRDEMSGTVEAIGIGSTQPTSSTKPSRPSEMRRSERWRT